MSAAHIIYANELKMLCGNLKEFSFKVKSASAQIREICSKVFVNENKFFKNENEIILLISANGKRLNIVLPETITVKQNAITLAAAEFLLESKKEILIPSEFLNIVLPLAQKYDTQAFGFSVSTNKPYSDEILELANKQRFFSDALFMAAFTARQIASNAEYIERLLKWQKIEMRKKSFNISFLPSELNKIFTNSSFSSTGGLTVNFGNQTAVIIPSRSGTKLRAFTSKNEMEAGEDVFGEIKSKLDAFEKQQTKS
jgi:hypothetical protein